jgi:BolA protein
MSVQTDIETKLTEALQPAHLEVINESSNHNVPPGSESHFKVVIVSQAFDGRMLVARHRAINEILADELQHKIHALALHTYTPEEWEEVSGQAPVSPPCLGGGKG